MGCYDPSLATLVTDLGDVVDSVVIAVSYVHSYGLEGQAVTFAPFLDGDGAGDHRIPRTSNGTELCHSAAR